MDGDDKTLREPEGAKRPQFILRSAFCGSTQKQTT